MVRRWLSLYSSIRKLVLARHFPSRSETLLLRSFRDTRTRHELRALRRTMCEGFLKIIPTKSHRRSREFVSQNESQYRVDSRIQVAISLHSILNRLCGL